MTTWDDIKKLAADLQRAQLSIASKKLSEANCVEVVSTLISKGLLDLVVTNDGREYVTRSHLVTEVRNECLASGGRIPLTECAAQLNVELNVVLGAAASVVRDGEAGEFVICAGELINREFINSLCDRLNLRLHEEGQLSVQQILKHWDLPTELLHNYVFTEIGRRIRAIRHDDHIHTHKNINSLRNRLYAILIALTKPFPLLSIFEDFHISQPLFYKVWDELVAQNTLPGRIVGGRTLKALYIPAFHDKCAQLYVQKRLSEQHFIEQSVFKKLHIVDIQAFLRNIFSSNLLNDFECWPSIILSKSHILEDCYVTAKNLLSGQHFFMVDELFPSDIINVLRNEDRLKFVDSFHICFGTKNSTLSTDDFSIVFNLKAILEKLMTQLQSWLSERAEKDALELRKNQNETKLSQKAVLKKQQIEDKFSDKFSKKKGHSKKQTGQKGKDNINNEKADQIVFPRLSVEEIFNQLEFQKIELPESLIGEISEALVDTANMLYHQKLSAVFQTFGPSENAREERRIHDENLHKLQDLYISVCTFEKGLDALQEPLRLDLLAHLQRTLCTDLAQSMLLAVSDMTSTQMRLNLTSSKVRDQLLASINDLKLRESLKSLLDTVAATSTNSLESFHQALAQMSQFEFKIRQPDRQERLSRASSYALELRQRLEKKDEDSASVLLATVLILTHYVYDCAVHASGKFVAPLISFLCSNNDKKKSLSADLVELLLVTQRLVVESFKRSSNAVKSKTKEKFIKDASEETALNSQLNEKMEQLKKYVFQLIEKVPEH